MYKMLSVRVRLPGAGYPPAGEVEEVHGAGKKMKS
jgi:hypothetical protein